MTWNYRLVKLGEEHYAVYEVYYKEDGEPYAMTSSPVKVDGENAEEIVASLKRIIRDIEQGLQFIPPEKWNWKP